MTSTPVATTQVLVVEDDPTVADVVVRYLEREGFSVRWAAEGSSAVTIIDDDLPDLIVLDLLVPEVDGFEILSYVRAIGPVPVIMLTALGGESDRVLGLELGADDYLAKPFSPRELVARVKAVLRRAAEPLPRQSGPVRLTADTLTIDVGAREVLRRDTPVALTAREFDLLVHFAAHPRQVFRREELLELVWGYSYGDASTVTVHIRRLREKIEDDPSAPKYITTVWGHGYRWDG